MRIALCQINTIVGDLAGNASKILEYAAKAKAEGADLAVFPELTITGYPLKDLVDNCEFVEESHKTLEYISKNIPDEIAIIIGGVFQSDIVYKPFNAAYFIYDKQIQFVEFKSLLPNYDVFDEERNYSSGKNKKPFEYKGVKIGISICEDAWANDINLKQIYLTDPIKELINLGAELIINISASPYCAGKFEKRVNLITDISTKYKTPVVYVNQVGGNDSLVFDGASFVVDKQGNVCCLAPKFSESISYYDTSTSAAIDINKERITPIQEMKEALVLGIRDYVHKCGFTSAVIGLSGGIDSAVVAALAVEALGKENVTGILMPSMYSSAHSINDAIELANNLDIDYKIKYIHMILEAYKRELSGSGPGDKDKTFGDEVVIGLAEENLQARIRGNMLMAWSNRYPKTIVLSTSNKSEASVGYGTLYGDLAGGLAPILDVWKLDVYRLAEYMNSGHKLAIIPFNTIYKPPSAELAVGQKDTDSLPPYEVLDNILIRYIEKKMDLSHIIQEVGNITDLATVNKVIGMVDRNEFKRQQSPPNIKISSLSFGPGRRMPIAKKLTHKN